MAQNDHGVNPLKKHGSNDDSQRMVQSNSTATTRSGRNSHMRRQRDSTLTATRFGSLSSTRTRQHTHRSTLSSARSASFPHSDSCLFAEDYDDDETDKPRRPTCRYHGTGYVPESRLGKILFSPWFEYFGGFVVYLHFVIMTAETHGKAVGDQDTLKVVRVFDVCLLTFYTIEVLCRLYEMRCSFFKCRWNNLDFAVVMAGLASEVLNAMIIGSDSTSTFKESLESINLLKNLRLVRLLRLIRLLVAFEELYVLVCGLARCMYTLFWAALLIFTVLNVWSILSVEYLDITVQTLYSEGAYPTCSWCKDAFANIFRANLTWFQIVSGDGWSVVGRPLIEREPWTYIAFASCVFVIMWGILNLIIAAIIESNIAAREDDIESAAKSARRAQFQALEDFRRIWLESDADGEMDRAMTHEEFREHVQDNPKLMRYLEVMGVRDKDLDRLLLLMDEDGNGLVDAEEFIEQFTYMRTLVERTQLFYLGKQVEVILDKISLMCPTTVTTARRRTSSTTMKGHGDHGTSTEDVHLASVCGSSHLGSSGEPQQKTSVPKTRRTFTKTSVPKRNDTDPDLKEANSLKQAGQEAAKELEAKGGSNLRRDGAPPNSTCLL